jgi:hypothetical protein
LTVLLSSSTIVFRSLLSFSSRAEGYVGRSWRRRSRIPDTFDGQKRAARKAKGKMQALLGL